MKNQKPKPTFTLISMLDLSTLDNWGFVQSFKAHELYQNIHVDISCIFLLFDLAAN